MLILSSYSTWEPSKEAMEARKKLRSKIDDQIKIVSGSIHATPEIIYKTIDDLYNDIVDLQGHGYIGGTFLTREAENRIYDKVMEKVNKHVDKIREELGLNDV